jgi:hypothetical protein
MPPIVEKIDPKDSNIILSSTTDDATTTVVTKIDDKSTKMTNDFNRDYVLAISAYLQPDIKEIKDPAVARANLESLILGDYKNKYVKYLQEKYGRVF